MSPIYKYLVVKECETSTRIGRRQFAKVCHKVGETLFLNPEAQETKSWLKHGNIERLEGANAC